ncbi:sirohydrochlorin chelatase [Pseudonocardiaceae bacterium YIM PH 21723]|nr:sirohydrochlorin chelatase [Pseudonocardiaceae bacterium YIM PH 21723]
MRRALPATLLLCVHGTRDERGQWAAQALRDAVADKLPGVPVLVAYADVCEPTLAQRLRVVVGPVVVIPVFLASGYHVRVDVPDQVWASGKTNVLVTEPPGPHPRLAAVAHDRLVRAGLRSSDSVVLGAAGSSDPRATADVYRAARALALRVGRPVPVGFLTGSGPSVAEVVGTQTGRVAVASWLLLPGEFHSRLVASGADVVAEPLGYHPGLAGLLARRYLDVRCYSVAA